ncbi:hypothetical protein DCAR_0625725 [Daucus carota subsp. sativus]|uniref:J domain-containing protein n=1 Tax=Daucus carota subsp. sativus TaxID=79200 RepID=A0AAF0XDZ5_DAUCS|nr:hypothetical protein DCAR_0625725 [Daucus carota subsp. sativus]
MDYYRVLGLNKSATKSEIKDAFRKLAVKFHPDKHTASSKSVKDSATLKFKQVSEAYDVLSDDRKRADYNSRSSYTSHTSSASSSSSYSRNYNYGHGYGSGSGYSSHNTTGYGYSYRRASSGLGFKFEKFARYLTTRDFLLHATFIGIILSGTFIIDKGRGLIWNLQNSGVTCYKFLFI